MEAEIQKLESIGATHPPDIPTKKLQQNSDIFWYPIQATSQKGKKKICLLHELWNKTHLGRPGRHCEPLSGFSEDQGSKPLEDLWYLA